MCMSKPTPVTTISIRSDKGSASREKPILLLPNGIHSNRVVVCCSNAPLKCCSNNNTLRANEMPIAPQPMRADTDLDNFLPNKPLSKNPTKGAAIIPLRAMSIVEKLDINNVRGDEGG